MGFRFLVGLYKPDDFFSLSNIKASFGGREKVRLLKINQWQNVQNCFVFKKPEMKSKVVGLKKKVVWASFQPSIIAPTGKLTLESLYFPVNPLTGELIGCPGVIVAEPLAVTPQRPKSGRVPPGGFSTPLW